jgi:hypothetical protein
MCKPIEAPKANPDKLYQNYPPYQIVYLDNESYEEIANILSHPLRISWESIVDAGVYKTEEKEEKSN